MIKLMFCIRKRADISHEEFHRYWLKEHGPLVKSHADTLKLRKYVQSHTDHTELGQAIAAGRGVKVPAFDGVAELWLDSIDDLQAGLATEEGVAASLALAEDEARFIDLENSSIFFVQEHGILDGNLEGNNDDT